MQKLSCKYSQRECWEEYQLQTRNEIVFGVSERQINQIKESILNKMFDSLEDLECVSSDIRDYELFMCPGNNPTHVVFHLEPSTICGRITLRKVSDSSDFEGDWKYLSAMNQQSRAAGPAAIADHCL